MEHPHPQKRLTSLGVVLRLLEEGNIRPSRSRGQNFLIDPNVLKVISRAAGLEPTDCVVEVGAGLGALTQHLLERCRRVYALESDYRLISLLEKELGHAGNLVLVRADAMKFDFAGLWKEEPPEKVKMVANLPYGIAANLLIDCLYRHPFITEYTVTVQREIAERLTSMSGNKDYSAATVKVRSRALARKVTTVSRNCFYPPPRVDSSIVHLVRLDSSSAEAAGLPPPVDSDSFERLVTAAFRHRRKKLVNALAAHPAPIAEKKRIRGALDALGKNPECRAEDLSPQEFVTLSNELSGDKG